MIITNKARCKLCGDVIESKYRHDFVSCSCGAIFVDGGHDYLRRGFKKKKDIEELSEIKHVCTESRSCCCYTAGLEPNPNCPVHGYPWPPRCEICGRFMKRTK